LLVGGAKPHNPSVPKTPWQQRIRRAEYLAGKHPYAAEILGFYVPVARFQEDLYLRIERSAGVLPAVHSAGSGQTEWASRPLPGQLDGGAANAELIASLPGFLRLVEDPGPVRLTQVARELRNADPSARHELLNAVWSTIVAPSEPEEFLALAFLQPYAEFVRTRVGMRVEGYTHPLCPLCNRKPALGVLRQEGDGGRRSLLCGFCVTEWEYRRIVCPGCGEEDHAKLPVYTADELPYIRVECCDTCKTYIKSIDLTKNGLADPMVDELASIPLSLWADEHGYAKLHPNLLGM
jgi:FdhE protein